MPPYFVSLEDLRKGVDWATTLERQFKFQYALDKRLPGIFSTAPAPTSHQIVRVRPPSDPARLSVLSPWSQRIENPACLEKCWACGKWRAKLDNEWVKGMWGWWIWNTLEGSVSLPVSWETRLWVKKQQLELDVEQGLVQNWERHRAKPCLLNFYAGYVMWNARLDEWITSWNQDCQESYQQPQIGRW